MTRDERIGRHLCEWRRYLLPPPFSLTLLPPPSSSLRRAEQHAAAIRLALAMTRSVCVSVYICKDEVFLQEGVAINPGEEASSMPVPVPRVEEERQDSRGLRRRGRPPGLLVLHVTLLPRAGTLLPR